MRKYRDDMEEFIYSIFGEELEAKDNEIAELDKKIAERNKELNEYRSKIKEMTELEDINSPEARDIVNSILNQEYP